MQRPLRRWLVSFPYDDTVQYGSLLGILGLVRRTVSVCIMLIVASTTLALTSDAGPSDRWTPFVVAILVLGVTAAVAWWDIRWPSERGSIAFIGAADLAIAAVLLTYTQPLLALAGTCLFTILGIYVSMLHGPRALAAHVLLSAGLACGLALRAVHQGVEHTTTASALLALLTVMIGVPVAVQIAWSTLRHEGMRSLVDPLTGLLNRRGLHTSILGALPELDPRRPDHRVVVVSADLDGFKRLNDAHGHEAGDNSLRRISTRLAARWEHGGRWARIGGEELVLVTTVDQDEVARIGPRAVGLIHEVDDPHPITASVGVVVTDHVPRSRRLADRRAWLDQLVARADEAMYEAKQAGGDRAVVLHDRRTHPRSPTT